MLLSSGMKCAAHTLLWRECDGCVFTVIIKGLVRTQRENRIAENTNNGVYWKISFWKCSKEKKPTIMWSEREWLKSRAQQKWTLNKYSMLLKLYPICAQNFRVSSIKAIALRYRCAGQINFTELQEHKYKIECDPGANMELWPLWLFRN